jgi:hypothetical protein
MVGIEQFHVQLRFADVMQSQSFQVVRKTELESQALEALEPSKSQVDGIS